MRPGSRPVRAVAAPFAIAIASLTVPGEASAQQASALDRFDPASTTGPFFAVPGAAVQGQLRPFAGAVLGHAVEPLALTRPGTPPVSVVDHQTVLHVAAGLELGQRGALELSAPTVLSQGGTASDVAAAPASAAAFGDLRLGGRLVVLPPTGHRPAAAVALDVWLPTAAEDAYAGAGVIRVAPRIVTGAEREQYAWGVTAASRLQPSRADDLPRSELEVGVAGGPRFGPLWVGPELVAQVLLEGPRGAAGDVAAEARLGAKLDLGPVRLGLAAGPGLGEAYGTPSFRVVGGVGVAFDATSPDGAAGARAGDPAPTSGSRPDAASTDGVEPRAEGAPTAARCAGPPDSCGVDADGDGVADPIDACPKARGARSLDARNHGCPPVADADRDGIADASDACAHEAGRANVQAAIHGCPPSIRFDGSQLVITQQVQFETGSDTLAASSDGVLADVARALAEHEDVARLAVDGHTDGEGDAAKNLLLSQRRALAVVRWLVDHGVDARRLEARGFGERRPIADDAHEEGRAKNRRVEFVVRKRTPLGREGWTDGPVE